MRLDGSLMSLQLSLLGLPRPLYSRAVPLIHRSMASPRKARIHTRPIRVIRHGKSPRTRP